LALLLPFSVDARSKFDRTKVTRDASHDVLRQMLNATIKSTETQNLWKRFYERHDASSCWH
jgi:hypothetical protein